jgi:hypothetical protein
MVSPVRGDYRRLQAEIPLIDLFKFAVPALPARRQSVRWQPRAHAGGVSRLSGSGDPQLGRRTRNDDDALAERQRSVKKL